MSERCPTAPSGVARARREIELTVAKKKKERQTHGAICGLSGGRLRHLALCDQK